MWLFVIILFGWLGWKMFNFSLEYILPIALIILAVMYALKFWWIILIIVGGWYLYHRRKLL
ncbi:MAG: hypothetical protein ABF741_01570 [Liquorilactobacillus ghanensis]|uniref:hypothetical protein n=1 Tax=Liquorilactobacillus ghanensis TaxID=399370 RepID=UPI0039E77EE0